MYLLRFFGRDELEQMTISKSKKKLKYAAMNEIDGDLSFRDSDVNETVWISCKKNLIGVIGSIKEV